MIMTKNNNKKVLVALSGGVDSAVTACLLKKQGYSVSGIYFKFSNKSDGHIDALKVCKKLEIPFQVCDFKKIFKKEIIVPFLKAYQKGLTPNPCVICNEKVKFALLLKKALALKIDMIATGHYVNIKKQKNIYTLLSGDDKNKDQIYFLYRLNQNILKHTLFPLGQYTKEQVRQLARKYQLPVAEKNESQEICFLKNIGVESFLKNNIKSNTKGLILDSDNNKLGEIKNIYSYTLGQRLPIGGNGPYYAVKKDLNKKIIIAGKKNDPLLFQTKFKINNINWISGIAPKMPLYLMVQTRYHGVVSKAYLQKNKNEILVTLSKKIPRAVSGQSAVFYQKNKILGGGIII